VFPLLAPFPPSSAAFVGLPVKVAPFPLIEVQALLAVRVMIGRVELDFNRELEITVSQNKDLLEAFRHSAERVAREWHVLDSLDLQYGYRENLWRLANEPDKTVPAWTLEFYEKKFILRDEWRDLVKRGEASSWAEGVGKGGIDEWVDLMYRVLRRAESRG
jgi:hypothetical protein